MYSQRAGPLNVLGPRRVRQPAVRFDDLPPISTVLLSHNHYDHCDRRTLGMLAERFDPIVGHAVAATARSCGRRAFAGSRSSTGGRRATSRALPIALTPARHFSARTPFDRNRALWGGFMLTPGGAAHLLRRRHRAMRRCSATSGSGSVRSIWRCCRSAPTSRAGSCRPFT